ncbi:MAG: tripartite tricarboxylate transporter substrate binding protein [Pusillimonas sp.]
MNFFFNLRWKKPGLRPTVAVALLTLSGLAAAAYPDRPVTLVVPFPPGGSTDVQARLVAKGLAQELGQPFVVENKAGAAGAIGARHVAQATADGYTLLFGSTSSLVTEPVLNKGVGFDPLRDFVPVSLVSDLPFLLVVECSSKEKSVDDLIKMAKENPGKLNYSSWGYGSAGNMLAEMFKKSADINVTHVPYKGEAPAVMGLLGKEVDMMFVTPVNIPHITGGKMCPLAITGEQRLSVLPDVPTFKEVGRSDMNLPMWFGVVAPANTPAASVDRLQQALANITKSAEFTKAAEPLGIVGIGSSAEQFEDRIKETIDAVTDLSKTATLRQ